MLALALGTVIIVIFVFVIVRGGLLAAIVALATHFILLRAPMTTDVSAWWAPIGLWYLGRGRGARLRRLLRRPFRARPASRASLRAAERMMARAPPGGTVAGPPASKSQQ